MGRRVAVVTGSNKGIGFAIVRALCKKFDGDVILTARDSGRGEQAIKDLQKEGLNPKFHQLDINTKSSTEALKKHLVDTYGGLDILINNAAIAYPNVCDVPFAEQVTKTFATNYWAVKETCEILFPILRPHARVVNVSSLGAQYVVNICSPAVKERILSTNSIPALDKLMNDYEKEAMNGTLKNNGWAASGYGMSKIAVRLLTTVQHREMENDPREDVVINCCCPGQVLTDMSGNRGKKTIDEGADTPVYLALLPAGIKSPRGEYLADRRIEQWQ